MRIIAVVLVFKSSIQNKMEIENSLSERDGRGPDLDEDGLPSALHGPFSK